MCTRPPECGQWPGLPKHPVTGALMMELRGEVASVLKVKLELNVSKFFSKHFLKSTKLSPVL